MPRNTTMVSHPLLAADGAATTDTFPVPVGRLKFLTVGQPGEGQSPVRVNISLGFDGQPTDFTVGAGWIRSTTGAVGAGSLQKSLDVPIPPRTTATAVIINDTGVERRVLVNMVVDR